MAVEQLQGVLRAASAPRTRGQAYRLVLTARQHARAHIVNLAARDVGERPFPVMSMPIVLSSRARTGAHAEKQQSIERVYRVPLQAEKDGFLTIREQTSFDLDKKVWDSGIGLSSWLVELARQRVPGDGEHQLVSRARDVLFASARCRVVELGAGTGIVSLTLGALRSVSVAQGSGCIFTTDLDSALPLLEHNVTANDPLFKDSLRPQPLALDWDEETLPSEVLAVEGGFDAIIMADVTYNTASFPALVRTLSRLLHLSPPDHPPIIVLGYKERDPEERTLWDMTKGIGVSFDRVGERIGAGRDPVEIWLGKYECGP
uniref:Secreted protein 1 n=1 Tax=Ganoderma boninense TaxID=34458 RepID=A0A5K1JVJ9_9APHY|nr:Secreted protein 1 [Ganoderma boninense]